MLPISKLVACLASIFGKLGNKTNLNNKNIQKKGTNDKTCVNDNRNENKTP